MSLTKRDYELLKFINSYRYASSTRIAEMFFQRRLRVAQRRLKKLFDEEILERERSYIKGEYVYKLGKLGISKLNDCWIEPFLYIKRIPWAIYEHEDYILNVVKILSDYDSSYDFVSERYLRKESKLKKSIIPDLKVNLSDNFSIGIEVEKERKTKKRYWDKLWEINRCGEFHTLLYILWNKCKTYDHLFEIYKEIDFPDFSLMIVTKVDFENHTDVIMQSIIKNKKIDNGHNFIHFFEVE